MSAEGNPIAIPLDSSSDSRSKVDRDANGDSNSNSDHQLESSNTLVTARSRQGSLFKIYGIEEETVTAQ
jgi:hypothetical protein